MKKRFIFDLDGTLLHGDYISERDYFRSVLNKEDAEKFLLLYFEKLCEYESLHQKYDYSSLSKFLSEKTGVNITSEIVEGWIKVNSKMDDKLLEETKSMLEYLKSKDKSLAVLTNWFKDEQEYLNSLMMFIRVILFLNQIKKVI